MAKNDMEVIQYKIMEYLYVSLKAGHPTSLGEIAWKCELLMNDPPKTAGR